MELPIMKKPVIASSPVVKLIVSNQLLLTASFGAFLVIVLTLLTVYSSKQAVGEGAVIGFAILAICAVAGTILLFKALRGRKMVQLLRQYVNLIFVQEKTKLDDVAQAMGKDVTQITKDINKLTANYYLAGVTCDTAKGEFVIKDLPVKVIYGNKDAKEQDKMELNCTSCGLKIRVAPEQICRCPRCYSAISINMKKYEKSQQEKAK